jgi:hypothetical protein
LGLGTKIYQGAFAWWFHGYAGAIFYEIFWMLLIAFIYPYFSITKNAITIFSVTASLEFLQLWQTPFLQTIRNTWLGRTLIGTSFVWWDFPYYLLGCLLGWLYLRTLQKYCQKP